MMTSITTPVFFLSDTLKVSCNRINHCAKPRTMVCKYGERLGDSIIYLLSDHFSCLLNNELHQLKKGTLIVLNPNERLELFVDEGINNAKTNVMIDGSCVHFLTVDIINDKLFDGDVSVESFMRAFSERKIYTNNFYTDADFHPQNIIESCSMILSDYIQNNLGEFYFKSVVSMMISQLNLAFDRHNNYVPTKYSDEYEVKVYDYISRNYNKDISIKSISEKYYISKVYINKITNRFYGMNFGETLKSMRMWKAILLMKTSSSDFKAISALCGYKNYSNFYRNFISFFGMTPSEKYKELQRLRSNESGDSIGDSSESGEYLT